MQMQILIMELEMVQPFIALLATSFPASTQKSLIQMQEMLSM
jgi:hypothetical protein